MWKILLPVLLLCAAVPAVAEEGPAREVLLAKPLQLPSPAIFAKVVRVTFPAGYKTPPHTHEGPGPRYVLKGEITVEDHGQTATYKAGQVFWESGEAMTAGNRGREEAVMVIFEMAPNAKPAP